MHKWLCACLLACVCARTRVRAKAACLQQLARRQQKIRVGRLAKLSIADCKGFVDQHPIARHRRKQCWQQGSVQIIRYHHTAEAGRLQRPVGLQFGPMLFKVQHSGVNTQSRPRGQHGGITIDCQYRQTQTRQ